MTKHTLDALNQLIDYVYDDEAKNYEEASEEEKKNHIFPYIQIVADYANKEVDNLQSKTN